MHAGGKSVRAAGAVGGALLTAAAAAAIAGAPSASAQEAQAQRSLAAPLSYCTTWIDGEWGKARCYNDAGFTRTAWIQVTCVDWWDPDVRNTATVQHGSDALLSGHCWGGVEKVEAGWE